MNKNYGGRTILCSPLLSAQFLAGCFLEAISACLFGISFVENSSKKYLYMALGAILLFFVSLYLLFTLISYWKNPFKAYVSEKGIRLLSKKDGEEMIPYSSIKNIQNGSGEKFIVDFLSGKDGEVKRIVLTNGLATGTLGFFLAEKKVSQKMSAGQSESPESQEESLPLPEEDRKLEFTLGLPKKITSLSLVFALVFIIALLALIVSYLVIHFDVLAFYVCLGLFIFAIVILLLIAYMAKKEKLTYKDGLLQGHGAFRKISFEVKMADVRYIKFKISGALSYRTLFLDGEGNIIGKANLDAIYVSDPAFLKLLKAYHLKPEAGL